MTYAAEKVKAGRRPFSVVELDLDACSLTFGIAPCTAAIVSNFWDLGTVSYDSGSDLDSSTEVTLPTGVAFSADGRKLFLLDINVNTIFAYTLSVPWDTSTSTYRGASKTFDPTEATTPRDIAISEDGFHLYVVGATNQKVYAYTLVAPNDISTAIYDGAPSDLDVSGEATVPQGLAISGDGVHLFICDTTTKKVFAYTLGTANDLSTATYDGVATDLDTSGRETDINSLSLSDDGLHLFLIGNANNTIYAYTLSTAWNPSTGTHDAGDDLVITAQDGSPFGIDLSKDGSKIIICGGANDKVYSYSLSTTLAKCFNTFATCEDTPNFDLEIKTYSFCSPEIGKSRAYDAIPSVRKIDVTPMKLDPGLSLGKRGAAKITFQDHPHHDRGVDKYALEREDGTAGSPAYTPHDQGSFFGKLTARNPHHVARIMRLKTGFIPWDQDLDPSNQASVSAAAAVADVLTRTYAIEQIDGPDASGKVTVTGKDLLKLADDERAECPVRSTGTLKSFLVSGSEAAISVAYDTKFQTAFSAANFVATGWASRNNGNHLFYFDQQTIAPFARNYRRWDMSTPYDISTAATAQSLDIDADAGTSSFVQWISFDGLHIVGRIGSKIISWTLSVPFDLTTAVFDAVGTQITLGFTVNSISTNHDGTLLYVVTAADDLIRTFLVATPWDWSTATSLGNQYEVDTSIFSGFVSRLDWLEDGSLFGADNTSTKDIVWWALTRPYDMSSAVYKGVDNDFDFGSESGAITAGFFDDQKIYGYDTGVGGGDKVWQYSWQLERSVTLEPSGIGNSEYDSSGTVRIEDELCEFTRSGDVLELVKRAAINTLTVTHDAGTIVQLCKKFDAQQIDLIIGTLLKDFAGISTTFIDEATWATEAAAFLSTFVYTALITEPTGVRKLINELCLQSNCLLYWHETDAEFKFVALRQPTTELTVTEQNMIAGSFKQVDLPKLRLTRVTIRFNRVTGTARLDNATSFLQTYQAVDADAETTNEFNDVRHMTVNSRWMGAGDLAIATEAADAILARYVTTPQQFIFALDVKDADIWTGSIINIQSRYEQDIYGADGSVVAQVIEVRETPGGGFVYKAISI